MLAHETSMLLLVALGAFVAPLLSRRVGVPAAVGEILLGAALAALVGPFPHGGLTEAIGEIGFILLMFGAGLEIDFDRIERGGGLLLAVAGAFVAASFLLAVLLSPLLGPGAVFTLALATMSIGVAIAALRETRRTATLLGQTVLIVGGLGEFVTMLLLTGLQVTTRVGFGPAALLEVGRLLAVLAVAYAVLLGLRALVWWYPEQVQRLAERHDPAEVGVRAALALMFGLVAVASMLEAEPILGAFLAGAVFGFVFREKETLEAKLSSIGYGFFVPVFFIGVGQDLHPTALLDLEIAQLALGLFVLTLVARLIPSLLFRLLGLGWRETLAAGTLLAAPLTLLVAVARIGLGIGILSEPQSAALVVTAVVMGIVLPATARALLPEPAAAGAAAQRAAPSA